MYKQTPNKTHLLNFSDTEQDYPNSPHPRNAIEDGLWTACKIITERITDDISLVTCKECLKIHNELKNNKMLQIGDLVEITETDQRFFSVGDRAIIIDIDRCGDYIADFFMNEKVTGDGIWYIEHEYTKCKFICRYFKNNGQDIDQLSEGGRIIFFDDRY